MLPKRAFLLLPAALAATGCARPDPPPPYLSNLETGAAAEPSPRTMRLKVAKLDIAPIPVGPAVYAIPPYPITPADAMTAMARRDLQPVGEEHTGRFLVLTARFDRHPSDAGSPFSGRTEMLHCTMRGALEVVASDGRQLGRAQAEAQVAATVPASTPAEQAESAARFMQVAMKRFGNAFEEAIQRNLRSYLIEARSATRTMHDQLA